MIVGLVLCVPWLFALLVRVWPGSLDSFVPLPQRQVAPAFLMCCCGELLIPLIGLYFGVIGIRVEGYPRWLACAGILISIAAEVGCFVVIVQFYNNPGHWVG
jgi:hypothetical protein